MVDKHIEQFFERDGVPYWHPSVCCGKYPPNRPKADASLWRYTAFFAGLTVYLSWYIPSQVRLHDVEIWFLNEGFIKAIYNVHGVVFTVGVGNTEDRVRALLEKIDNFSTKGVGYYEVMANLCTPDGIHFGVLSGACSQHWRLFFFSVVLRVTFSIAMGMAIVATIATPYFYLCLQSQRLRAFIYHTLMAPATLNGVVILTRSMVIGPAIELGPPDTRDIQMWQRAVGNLTGQSLLLLPVVTGLIGAKLISVYPRSFCYDSIESQRYIEAYRQYPSKVLRLHRLSTRKKFIAKKKEEASLWEVNPIVEAKTG